MCRIAEEPRQNAADQAAPWKLHSFPFKEKRGDDMADPANVGQPSGTRKLSDYRRLGALNQMRAARRPGMLLPALEPRKAPALL